MPQNSHFLPVIDIVDKTFENILDDDSEKELTGIIEMYLSKKINENNSMITLGIGTPITTGYFNWMNKE